MPRVLASLGSDSPKERELHTIDFKKKYNKIRPTLRNDPQRLKWSNINPMGGE
jgi:hypothetical protein